MSARNLLLLVLVFLIAPMDCLNQQTCGSLAPLNEAMAADSEYDGEWYGRTDQNYDVYFFVSASEIIVFETAFDVSKNGCSRHLGTGGATTSINGDKFTISADFPGYMQFTVTGTITTENDHYVCNGTWYVESYECSTEAAGKWQADGPPAVPASFSFLDVPSNYWAHDDIEKLLAAGITTGCGDHCFCPEETVTRAQMAVFLERGIHENSFEPPEASGGVFDDIPIGYWAADWIEQFYADGITSGCNSAPPLYCPEQSITRAEMAVLLLRTKYSSSYSPPPASGVFADVPMNNWAVDWIEQLYVEGITSGCGGNPLRFCPDDSVSRSQMAAFLVRVLGL